MPAINNEIYSELGERWYDADDDPVALLRAESRLRNPWVRERLREQGTPCRVLDVGCGAGFLTNYLQAEGFNTVGVDTAESALRLAAARDTTRSVKYVKADIRALPFEDQSFDAVCAMDVLEHVEPPEVVVAEAARVLRPGGTFFFHTFNRTFLSYLLAVKGVEWAVRNTPPHLHLYRLFIKPQELGAMCVKHGLAVTQFKGVAPVVFSGAFGKLLVTGRVPPDFRFRFVRSLQTGYLGEARKR